MKSLLPIILVILLLTGAITYALSKNTLPKLVTKQESVSPNELEVDSFVTPTPSATPTPSVTPKATITPAKSVKIAEVPTITAKNGLSEPKSGNTEDFKIVDKTTNKIITTKVTKTTICTPVYGSANTCVEHEVVDTGAEDALFFNFAGLSYLAGLVAFIKSKYA